MATTISTVSKFIRPRMIARATGTQAFPSTPLAPLPYASVTPLSYIFPSMPIAGLSSSSEKITAKPDIQPVGRIYAKPSNQTTIIDNLRKHIVYKSLYKELSQDSRPLFEKEAIKSYLQFQQEQYSPEKAIQEAAKRALAVVQNIKNKNDDTFDWKKDYGIARQDIKDLLGIYQDEYGKTLDMGKISKLGKDSHIILNKNVRDILNSNIDEPKYLLLLSLKLEFINNFPKKSKASEFKEQLKKLPFDEDEINIVFKERPGTTRSTKGYKEVAAEIMNDKLSSAYSIYLNRLLIDVFKELAKFAKDKDTSDYEKQVITDTFHLSKQNSGILFEKNDELSPELANEILKQLSQKYKSSNNTLGTGNLVQQACAELLNKYKGIFHNSSALREALIDIVGECKAFDNIEYYSIVENEAPEIPKELSLSEKLGYAIRELNIDKIIKHANINPLDFGYQLYTESIKDGISICELIKISAKIISDLYKQKKNVEPNFTTGKKIDTSTYENISGTASEFIAQINKLVLIGKINISKEDVRNIENDIIYKQTAGLESTQVIKEAKQDITNILAKYQLQTYLPLFEELRQEIKKSNNNTPSRKNNMRSEQIDKDTLSIIGFTEKTIQKPLTQQNFDNIMVRLFKRNNDTLEPNPIKTALVEFADRTEHNITVSEKTTDVLETIEGPLFSRMSEIQQGMRP